MKYEKTIKEYLRINNINLERKELDYSISLNCNYEKFLEEIAILFERLKNTYFNNGVMLYSFNDWLLVFECRFDYFKTLFNLSIKHDNKNIKQYLSHFILSYQFSIESERYKKSTIYTELTTKFYESFDKSCFYNNSNFCRDSLDYLLNLIIILKNKKEKIYYYFLEEHLYVLLDRCKNTQEYKDIINVVIQDVEIRKYIFDFDYDKIMHRDLYNEYINYEIKHLGITVHKLSELCSFIGKLNKEKILTVDSYKEVLNEVINHVNRIANIMHNFNEAQIQVISDIDNCIDSLNNMKSISCDYAQYKEKIEECIKSILYCKRKFIKYDNPDMKTFEFEINMNDPIFNEIDKVLSKDISLIYKFLIIDFEKELKGAIEGHSEHPIIDYITQISVDSKLGLYKNVGDVNGSLFQKYYNKRGNEIEDEIKDQLINSYRGNYYVLMLRRVSNLKTLTAQLLFRRHKNKIQFDLIEIIKNSFESNSEFLDDEYLLCCRMIITIESIVCEILKRNNLEYKKDDMEANLWKLFSFYKDSSYKNLIMNIYYVLYAEYGLECRNNFMHGNIIHKSDYYIELMYIYMCLIIAVFLRN